jgi:hypothetical protein
MSDEWYTPKTIFEQMGREFYLDVCAPENGVDWVPVVKWFSIKDDGLLQKWSGAVWMNPPYSRPAPWVEKWLNHSNGVALLPMAKSKWFNNLMNSEAKFVLLPSTFKFQSPDGKPLSLMMASTLWALGEANIEAISKVGKIR